MIYIFRSYFSNYVKLRSTWNKYAKRNSLLSAKKIPIWEKCAALNSLFHTLPIKHRVRIWRERGSALYQKRIDGRKTRGKSFICVCARRRQPPPRNKFSVRNVICTRSGKLRTLQRKLSRATSRVVKSSSVACPSPAVLRRYQRLCPPRDLIREDVPRNVSRAGESHRIDKVSCILTSLLELVRNSNGIQWASDVIRPFDWYHN